MGHGLGQNIQVHRACAAAEPGLSLLCPVPILSPTSFQRCSCYLHFRRTPPQAVKEPREVRTRAKATSLEREPLLCTQVSVLLQGLFQSWPPAPPQAPAPAAHKNKSLTPLPCGWLECEPRLQEFTLFEIKTPDLTLQLQVAADSINNLFISASPFLDSNLRALWPSQGRHKQTGFQTRGVLIWSPQKNWKAFRATP